jgi:hypothetical protein
MRSIRVPGAVGKKALRLFSCGMATITLATALVVARASDANAAPPPVTTKVSIVVDDVFCPPPFNVPPCKGYGTHLVPDEVPVGPVEFTLLDRRPQATRVGALSVFINGAGFSVGDGPSFTHHLAGDGSSLTVNATQVTTGMNVHIANSASSPQPYFTHTGFFDVIPTGAPYLTESHIDIVADSDGDGYGTILPSSTVPLGVVEVFVLDERANPLATGPLHVFTASSNLPFDITAPAGEVCGVTVLCDQTIVAATGVGGQVVLLRAPSIGGPAGLFDIALMSATRPILASNDAVKDVSLELTGALLATEREMRILETTGDPYTTYAHPATGNTNIRFDNQSNQTHTCSIPGYVNPFTLGKTSNITKHVALNSHGLTLTAQCADGTSTKYFTIFVY